MLAGGVIDGRTKEERMRIVAGILLIVAGVINGCAGAGYVAGGAIAGGAGQLGSAVQAELAKQGQQMAAQDKAKFDKAVGEAKAAGGTFAIFGIFLFVMLGLQIAGAVVLFIRKAKGFALTVGALTVLTEIVGIALTGFKIFSVVGFAAAAFAIIAAMGYAKAQASAAPAVAA
jgi:hypothetical protein